MVGSRCNFVEQVLVQAWRRPDDISVVGPAGQWTYGELDGLSAGIAQELTDAGVWPGAMPTCRWISSIRWVSSNSGGEFRDVRALGCAGGPRNRRPARGPILR